MQRAGSFGIRVPGGSPDALEGAAGEPRAVSGSFERAGYALRDSASTPYWTGIASFQFQSRCVSHAEVIASGDEVLEVAARIVSELAAKLEAAKRATKAALEDARQPDTRRDRAQRELDGAQAEAGAARMRAWEAEQASGLASLTGTPNPAADAARLDVLNQAQAAETRAQGAAHAPACGRRPGGRPADGQSSRA